MNTTIMMTMTMLLSMMLIESIHGKHSTLQQQTSFYPHPPLLPAFISPITKPPPPPTTTHRSKTSLHSSSYSAALQKRSIKLPLLDLSSSFSSSSSSSEQNILVPLPSSHLPPELSTPFLYGMELVSPLYKMLIKDVINNPITQTGGVEESEERLYGCVVTKGEQKESSLVGAIGCAATLLIGAPAPAPAAAAENSEKEGKKEEAMMVLSKGAFRFVVKEIIQSYPYPVAIVDELVDYKNDHEEERVEAEEKKKEETVVESSEDSASSSGGIVEYNDFGESDIFFNDDETTIEDKDDDDDDEYDVSDLYPATSPSDLIKRTLETLHSYLSTKLSSTNQPKSILEQHILEQTGLGLQQNSISSKYEECLAILELLPSFFLDEGLSEVERLYVVGFLAAEMLNVENKVRIQLLKRRNGVERMKLVLRELERVVARENVKKMTEEISEQSILKDRKEKRQKESLLREEKEEDGDSSESILDAIMKGDENVGQSIDDDDDDDDDSGGEDAKDLQIGTPSLPPWASSIKKGTRIEYFWNEEYGWCGGVVSSDPVQIMDELIMEVTFDDGETHKIPFSADEKVRWRPG